jgi:transcriptional regulator with XRE-family HTH domain
MNPTHSPTRPGAVLKSIRIRREWTLAEVSRRTGFPVSTLSKMENDRVSLTYDKLMRLSAGMGIDISLLFGASTEEATPATTQGRRSVTRSGEGRVIDSPNYLHLYAAAELLNKRLIPIVVEHKARSLEEFGELVRHVGEEFIYVLEGEVDVHTNLYAPVRLKVGDSIYLDSTMAHGYVAAAPGPCRVLAVCSGNENQMIAAVGGGASEGGGAATATVTSRTKSPAKRKSPPRKPR